MESTIRRQGKESVYCKICEVCYDKESRIFYFLFTGIEGRKGGAGWKIEQAGSLHKEEKN